MIQRQILLATILGCQLLLSACSTSSKNSNNEPTDDPKETNPVKPDANSSDPNEGRNVVTSPNATNPEAPGEKVVNTNLSKLKMHKLVAGNGHACYLRLQDNKVWCWGADTHGQTKMPSAVIPNMISANYIHSCVLDGDKVICTDKYWNDRLGSFKNVQYISSGTDHLCAIFSDKVQCIGDSSFLKFKMPALKNPYALANGASFACALDDEGVKCWGSILEQPVKMPALNKPTQISAGFKHACALDNDGVKCWGNNDKNQLNVPTLNQPKMLASKADSSCVIDADGVKCWGENLDKVAAPKLVYPRELTVGNQFACAVDQEGVKCWGANSNIIGKTPTEIAAPVIVTQPTTPTTPTTPTQPTQPEIVSLDVIPADLVGTWIESGSVYKKIDFTKENFSRERLYENGTKLEDIEYRVTMKSIGTKDKPGTFTEVSTKVGSILQPPPDLGVHSACLYQIIGNELEMECNGYSSTPPRRFGEYARVYTRVVQ